MCSDLLPLLPFQYYNHFFFLNCASNNEVDSNIIDKWRTNYCSYWFIYKIISVILNLLCIVDRIIHVKNSLHFNTEETTLLVRIRDLKLYQISSSLISYIWSYFLPDRRSGVFCIAWNATFVEKPNQLTYHSYHWIYYSSWKIVLVNIAWINYLILFHIILCFSESDLQDGNTGLGKSGATVNLSKILMHLINHNTFSISFLPGTFIKF